MSSIYTQVRREVSTALGEAATESCWVEAGIAVEVIRQRLERLMAGASVQFGDGPPEPASELIRNLLTVPSDNGALA